MSVIKQPCDDASIDATTTSSWRFTDISSNICVPIYVSDLHVIVSRDAAEICKFNAVHGDTKINKQFASTVSIAAF
jgi:hypothetical protein